MGAKDWRSHDEAEDRYAPSPRLASYASYNEREAALKSSRANMLLQNDPFVGQLTWEHIE